MGDREKEVKLLAMSREQLDSLARRPTMGGFLLSPPREKDQEDVYLETEDFRLFRAGLSFRYRSSEGGIKATLKEVLPATKRNLLKDRMEAEEDLGAELPDLEAAPSGTLGLRIGPLLGSRPIGPVVRIRTHRRTFRIGPVESPAAILCLDRAEVLPGKGGDPVGSFYEAEIENREAGPGFVESVGEDLLLTFGLLPSNLSKYERGLAILGILADARGEDLRYETALRPDDRLIDAAYRVFRKHFERMKMNEPGTRIGEDPEFLHDMRVSTRRIRAAFRTFRGAFHPTRLAGFNRELKWVAATLGAVRDLDVYLERFPEYTAGLSEADRRALDPFRAHLESEREKCRGVLIRALETKRYSSFLERFDRFLTRGAPKRPALASAREPVTEAAPRRISKALRRVLKPGRAVPADPPAQALHDLRIRCKRLRYTCEFFSELYGKPMRRFNKSVVLFQDLLGAHQDACVAEEALRNFAGGLRVSRRELVSTALVLGQVIAAQEKAAAGARSQFRAAWKAFDQKRIRRKMWS